MTGGSTFETLGLSVDKHFRKIMEAAHDVIQTSLAMYLASDPAAVKDWLLPWRRVRVALRRRRARRAYDAALSDLVRLTLGTLIAVGDDAAWRKEHPAETKLLLACLDFTRGEQFTVDERLDALVRGHDDYRAFRAEHDGDFTNWPEATGTDAPAGDEL